MASRRCLSPVGAWPPTRAKAELVLCRESLPVGLERIGPIYEGVVASGLGAN
jgi:hypothetical protein